MKESDVAVRARALLREPSVVGFEDHFFDVLQSIVEDFGRSVERRPGIMVVAGGPTSVSAHVDRHGFVTGRNGHVTYASSIAAHRALTPRQSAIVCERFAGERVTAYEPATGRPIADGTIEHGAHCGVLDVDIVVAGLAEVEPGMPVGFAPGTDASDTQITGQLDNVVSVAIAIELLADGFDGTVLFTAGEESGTSWKALVEWCDTPTNDLVVLDTSPFDDDGPARRGAVVLRRRDAGGAFSESTTNRMADAAARSGLEVLWKDEILAAAGRGLGRTELGRVVEATGGAVTGTTLQVPTTDYHTNHESTTLAAIGAVSRTLQTFLSSS